MQVDDHGCSRVPVRSAAVDVAVTTTRRRKEISLVVFNPIFIALLPPSPRRNDIVEASSSPRDRPPSPRWQMVRE